MTYEPWTLTAAIDRWKPSEELEKSHEVYKQWLPPPLVLYLIMLFDHKMKSIYDLFATMLVLTSLAASTPVRTVRPEIMADAAALIRRAEIIQCTCDGRNHPQSALDDAETAVGKQQTGMNGKTKSAGGKKYPRNYKNSDDIQFNSACDGLPLLEWPLLEDNELFVKGDKPGLDRLVLGVHTDDDKFDGLSLCGCIRHPDANSAGFLTCTFDGSA